jgi:hypothetical protein
MVISGKGTGLTAVGRVVRMLQRANETRTISLSLRTTMEPTGGGREGTAQGRDRPDDQWELS